VINSILKDLDYNNVAITSIGLDGEKVDQVTFMEKPRIFVQEGYIIATASDTLKMFEAEFEELQTTNIYTPIGPIIIVKIKKAGNALIAGPSVVFDMEKIIQLLEGY